MILLLAITGLSRADDMRKIDPPQCSDTTVKQVSSRLVDPSTGPMWESGASVSFANGVVLTAYNTPTVVRNERTGDKVQVCLVAVPKVCPPGDDRGKEYSVYDYQQKASYTMANSEHTCGGA